MNKNATRQAPEDFEPTVRAAGKKPIFHCSDLKSAQSIYKEAAIYGTDIVNSAHFHYTRQGARGQAERYGIFLGFEWGGSVVKVDVIADSTTHGDQRPNILFDVPISEFDDRTWELRLYPGTVGLMLSYIEIGRTGYLLHAPLCIKVIDDR
ncbi:hypothetical protein [Massilia haematophila]|uniref:Uncharacterized protein n=1 Tax=Massilia haematophila TaxID=457923 RepID=A0ABV7PFQ7_9BURK